MPPKKKVGAPMKAAKSGPSEPDLEIPPSGAKRIPRKPLFINEDFHDKKRIPMVRAKLWKVRSCNLPKYFPNPGDYFYSKGNDLEGFAKQFKDVTLQKSLKHVKRISIGTLLLSRSIHFRKLCSSWRPNSLHLEFREKFRNIRAFKALLNPNLRFCLLSFKEKAWVNPKLLIASQIVTKCKLFLHLDLYSVSLTARVKIDQLQKLKRIKPTQDESSRFAYLRNQALINAPECFEPTYFSCSDYKIDDLPPLPNLQEFKLRLVEDDKNEETVKDVSFLKLYPKLQCLALELGKREIENFEAINALTDLKEFHLFSKQFKPRKDPPRILPDLTKLEKLTLSLYDHPIFDLEDVKNFINKNRDLKCLNLTLTVPDAAIILEEDDNFTLPDIETLQLELVKLEKPTGGAKIIAETLRNHPSIKTLALRPEQSNSNLNTILFKDAVARMKSLEKLAIQFYRLSGGLEENKFKHLKNIFTNLTDLVELDLNLSQDNLPSRELSSILDWVLQLKNLKKLSFLVRCTKPTPATSDKLSNFRASFRHLKEVWISVWDF